MERDLSRYPTAVRRILQNEDSLIGFFAMWAIGLAIFPTGGFYIGTIASPASNNGEMRHYWDLRVEDIHYGGYGALIGLVLGIGLGLWATFRYPVLKERDALMDIERERELHARLTDHEIIATDSGQMSEHESGAH